MIKRPLYYLVSVIVLGFALSGRMIPLLRLQHWIFMLAALVAGLAIFWNRKNVLLVLSILTAFTFSISYQATYDHFLAEPVRALQNRQMQVTAQVISMPSVYEDEQRVELRITQTSDANAPHSFRTLCYLPLTEAPLQQGDTISAKLSFYTFSVSGGFDRRVYQASKGIYIASRYAKAEDGTPVSFSVTPGTQNLFNLPGRISAQIKSIITSYLPQREAGLLQALLLGDKTNLAQDDYLHLRKAGLSHAVAVSGMHIGLLVSLCCMVFGKRFGTVISVLVILFFIPIAGMTPSIIRAGLMYLIAAGAFWFRKENDSLHALFLVLLFCLLTNPHSIRNISLQLSFSATLGLILCAGKLQAQLMRLLKTKSRALRKAAQVFFSVISCSVCALLFTAPFLFTSFGYVSVLSLLSNLFAIGVLSICFVGGILLCLTSFIPPVAAVLGSVLTHLCRYVFFVSDRVAALPFGLIRWDDLFGVLSIAVCAVFVLALVVYGKKIKMRYAIPSVCGILIVLTALSARQQSSSYAMTCLPCGTGQTILLSYRQEELTVIDCGTYDYDIDGTTLREWMEWNGYDAVDTLILTAVDKTHSNALPALLDTIPIGQIYMPSGCRESRYNKSYLSLLAEAGAQTVQTSQKLSGTIPVFLQPITDGKLGVQVGQSVWILQSATQKQLATYLEDAVITAPYLVLSQRNIEDGVLLREALSKLQTNEIILQSSTATVDQLDGVPVRSTHDIGEITDRYPLGG